MTNDLLDLFDEYEPLQNDRGRNDRFEYARVRRGSEWYFLKKPISPSLGYGILREQQWAMFMQFVEKEYPFEHLKGPDAQEVIDDKAIVFGFIDAPHLSNEASLEDWRKHIDRYARTLYILDSAAGQWSAPIHIDRRSRSEHYYDIWQEWLGANLPRVHRLAEAKALVDSRANELSTRFQHGDLTPWQIFDDNGTWIIIDGEKSGKDLFRYNDLAYGYGRLYTLLRSPGTASLLLRKFIDVSGVKSEEFFREFMPVMTGRAVGMLADAYNDEFKDAGSYVDLATKLLDDCIDGNTDGLLGTR